MADISSYNREQKKLRLKRQVVTGNDYEDDDEELIKDNKKKHRKRRVVIFIILLILIAAAVIGIIAYSRYYTYSGYDTSWSIEMNEGSFVGYEKFGNNVLKYSKDGASYIDSNGKNVWIESYEMRSPVAAVSGDFAAIADKQGNSIYICDKNGCQGIATTLLPIIRVTVAANGITAVIMEDTNSGYISFFKKDGTSLDITIKTKMSGNGYPMDIALSPDGTQLICSYMYISGGELKSRVVFYDFSEIGKNVPNRLVGGFDDPFTESMIPRVHFFSQTYSAAYADTGLAFFSSKNLASPELIKQINIEEEIDSIVYGGNYTGVVVAAESGENPYRMDIYRQDGSPVFSKEFDFLYNGIDIDGDYVILYNDSACRIYNMYGTLKLSAEFEFSVSKVTRGAMPGSFIVTGPNNMQEIKLH